jgi:hypothetical protein
MSRAENDEVPLTAPFKLAPQEIVLARAWFPLRNPTVATPQLVADCGRHASNASGATMTQSELSQSERLFAVRAGTALPLVGCSGLILIQPSLCAPTHHE